MSNYNKNVISQRWRICRKGNVIWFGFHLWFWCSKSRRFPWSFSYSIRVLNCFWRSNYYLFRRLLLLLLSLFCRRHELSDVLQLQRDAHAYVEFLRIPRERARTRRRSGTVVGRVSWRCFVPTIQIRFE